MCAAQKHSQQKVICAAIHNSKKMGCHTKKKKENKLKTRNIPEISLCNNIIVFERKSILEMVRLRDEKRYVRKEEMH